MDEFERAMQANLSILNDARPIPGTDSRYWATRDGGIIATTQMGTRRMKLKTTREGDVRVGVYCYDPETGYAKQRMMLVRRAVALAWIPNPDLHPYVLQIDGDQKNCTIDNLRWSPTKRPARGDGRPGKRAEAHPRAKPVSCFDPKTGRFVATFASTLAAAKALRHVGCTRFGLRRVIAGAGKQCAGFTWKWAAESPHDDAG